MCDRRTDSTWKPMYLAYFNMRLKTEENQPLHKYNGIATSYKPDSLIIKQMGILFKLCVCMSEYLYLCLR